MTALAIISLCRPEAAAPVSDMLELIADQITRTIYCSPFTQATRRQQELALTCALKIHDAMQEAHACPP